jgi:hypothetical protein
MVLDTNTDTNGPKHEQWHLTSYHKLNIFFLNYWASHYKN